MASLGNMQRNRKGIQFIRDIPPTEYQKLCRLLDVVESSEMNWRRLAAILGFHNDEIDGLTLETYRPGGSPTHTMLRTWDHMNHTVIELYNSLYQMKHGRAMSIIMDYVDEKEHYKIELCRGIIPEACKPNPQDRQSRPFHQDMDPLHLPSPPLPPMTNATAYPNHGYYNPNPHRPVENVWNGTRYAQTGGGIPGPNGLYYTKPADAHVMYPNMDTQCNKELMSPEFDSRFNRHVTSSDNQSTKSSATSTTLHAFNYLNSFRYDKIARATENFSDKYKRGEGAFGTVYYATIDLSDFAVKKMKQRSEMGYDAEKFACADQLKEIPALVRNRHQNIIPLLGYSVDGPSLCLLYEYCEHGSLEDNLQGRDGRKPLDWATRHNIVLGAAVGLNFLHCAQPDKPLIHGDIKSANILLGKDFVPKIGDFGLARHGPTGGKLYTIMKTSEAHGTLPYLPNEYRRNRKLSTKVDVYSFGVVLLEVLTGQRAFDDKREPRGHQLLTELIHYTKDHNSALEDVIEKLRDPKCASWPWDLAGDLLEIAFRCIDDKFQKRPEMKKVADELYTLNVKCKYRVAMKSTEGQNGLLGAQMMQSPMNSICGSICTIKPALTQNEVADCTNGQVQQSVNNAMKTECNESLSESQKLQGKLEGLHIGMHNGNSQMFTNSGNRVDTQEISMWHKYGPCESSDSSLNTSKMYSNGYSTEATPNSSVRTPSSVPTSHLYDSSMPTTGSSFDQAQSIDKNVRTQNDQNPCHRVPHQGGCSPVGMLQSGEQNFQRPQFPGAQENYKTAEVQYTNHNAPQSDLASNHSCQNDALQPNCLKTPESCHSVNPFATPEIDGNLIPDPSLVASPQFLSHHFASSSPRNVYIQNVQLSMNTSQNERMDGAGADFTSKSVVPSTSSGDDERQPDSVPDSSDA